MVNTEQPVVKSIITDATASLEKDVEPIRKEIDSINTEITADRKAAEEKKETADTSEKEKKVSDLRAQEEKIISEYAAGVPKIRQVIDLALLRSHLLKGEALNAFIRRSVELLEK